MSNEKHGRAGHYFQSFGDRSFGAAGHGLLDTALYLGGRVPVREFGTVCHVACEHLTSATNILKHY